MFNYEIFQDKNIFYTKGFEAETGFEFEIELDDLTAKRQVLRQQNCGLTYF